ncbi:Neurotransmitter-gated ion-channel ligand-binding domain-containing protein [uncultured Gammaproteobacteria bacterium]
MTSKVGAIVIKVALLVLLSWNALGTAVAGEPNQVKVGIYVTQLYDFDMSKRSFNISFWTWFLYPDETYKPLETIEIVNAKTSQLKFTSTVTKEDVLWGAVKKKIWWAQGKYSALISEDWNVTNFPFDRQVLYLDIEDGQSDTSQVVFVADVENSRIDAAVTIPGWTVENFKIKSVDSVYNTTYGDPLLTGTSTYSKIIAQIVVKRDGWRLLCNMFIGFFVAFSLVSLTYFMDAETMGGSRIGLCAGAIFAATGNKYIIDGYLPHSSIFTLADSIEVSTFMTILFSILIVIIVMLVKPKRPRLAMWLNYLGAKISIIGYVVWNSYAIYTVATSHG